MAIEKAARSDPESSWWIKGDGVDIVKGLVRGIWSGDVDLADGKRETMIKKYQDRQKWIGGLGLNERCTCEVVKEDLSCLLRYLCMDLDFIYQSRFENCFVLCVFTVSVCRTE